MEKDHIERGNLMWEGSRMMLPEHVQALRDKKKNIAMNPKPDLSEDDFNEMGIIASASHREKRQVYAIYWEDGYYQKVEGVITRIDAQLRQIKINENWYMIDQFKSIEAAP